MNRKAFIIGAGVLFAAALVLVLTTSGHGGGTKPRSAWAVRFPVPTNTQTK